MINQVFLDQAVREVTTPKGRIAIAGLYRHLAYAHETAAIRSRYREIVEGRGK